MKDAKYFLVVRFSVAPQAEAQLMRWLDGGPPPETRLEDSIHDTALTMAAIESAHTGQVVDVTAYTAEHLATAGREVEGAS